MPALDGMRILDMTQYEAGPSCTQALAWMGADVVKVEAPGLGDPGRWTAGLEDAPYFWNWNANKRSIALDLTKPEGRELLLELAPRFDVFVENYGPGVIERLDLSYERLKAVHPTIIYAQIKGFGTSGPYAGYLAYDVSAQAAAGRPVVSNKVVEAFFPTPGTSLTLRTRVPFPRPSWPPGIPTQ